MGIQAGRCNVTDCDKRNPRHVVPIPLPQITMLPPASDIGDKDEKAEDDKSNNAFNKHGHESGKPLSVALCEAYCTSARSMLSSG